MAKLAILSAAVTALGLSACAGTPQQPAPQTQAAAPAPAKADSTRVKLSAANVAEAQHAGYKIINKDGQRLYCRKDFVTGSHVQTKATCLTEQELQQLNEETRAAMRALQVPDLPKPGT